MRVDECELSIATVTCEPDRRASAVADHQHVHKLLVPKLPNTFNKLDLHLRVSKILLGRAF